MDRSKVIADLKKKRLRARIIIGVVIALAIGIIIFLFVNSKKSQELVYETEKLEKGRIMSMVSSTGSLSPVVTVDVGSQVSGTISSVNVDFNDRVHKGQILAKIDTSLFETQLDQAQAKLENARAQLTAAQANHDKANIAITEAQAGVYQARAEIDTATADLESARGQLSSSKAAARKAKAQMDNDYSEFVRSKELFNRNLISQSERDKASTLYEVSRATYESSKAAIKSAEAGVKAAQSRVDAMHSTYNAAVTKKDSSVAAARAAMSQITSAQATIQQAQGDVNSVKVNIDRSVIRSPIDGIVINRKVEPGQTVAASFQTPVLFQIAENLQKMQVSAAVDEADIGKVKSGQTVKFTVDAFPEENFTGVVDQVRSSPKTEQNVVTYEVIILTDNRDMKLKPGMTANIDITVGVKENILEVPNAALRFRPDRIPNFPFPDKGGKGKGRDKGMANNSKGSAGGPFGRPPGPPPGAKNDKDNLEPDMAQVWVLVDGKPKMFLIKTGISDNNYTEMVSGELQEGVEIITDAYTVKEKDQKEKKRRQIRVRF